MDAIVAAARAAKLAALGDDALDEQCSVYIHRGDFHAFRAAVAVARARGCRLKKSSFHAAIVQSLIYAIDLLSVGMLDMDHAPLPGGGTVFETMLVVHGAPQRTAVMALYTNFINAQETK